MSTPNTETLEEAANEKYPLGYIDLINGKAIDVAVLQQMAFKLGAIWQSKQPSPVDGLKIPLCSIRANFELWRKGGIKDGAFSWHLQNNLLRIEKLLEPTTPESKAEGEYASQRNVDTYSVFNSISDLRPYLLRHPDGKMVETSCLHYLGDDAQKWWHERNNQAHPAPKYTELISFAQYFQEVIKERGFLTYPSMQDAIKVWQDVSERFGLSATNQDKSNH